MILPFDRRHTRRGAGFTLVELLVALTIGVLVLGGLSQMLFSVSRAGRTVSASSRGDRIARTVLDGLSRELTGVLASIDTTPLIGVNSEEKDEITIWTGAENHVSRVRYRWIDDILVRTESDPLRPHSHIEDPLGKITGLGLRYYDGKRWRDSWSGNLPPRGVAVNLHIGAHTYGTIFLL